MTARSERLHGLDAVRGYALLLGVVFHATMSFLPGPQIWPVADSERTPVLGAVFFAAHTFRMTTFFLIAGFFAHMTFHKRGPRGFVVDRLKRIALPLLVFWPISLVGILLAAGYAVYVATGVFPTRPPPSPAAAPGAFPLTHLWFLYTLLWLYAGALAVRGLVVRLDGTGAWQARADRLTARLVASPLSPALLAIPVAVAFYVTPGWRVWFGVQGPDSNLVPNLPAAVQYALAFGFGWVLQRQPGLLETWACRWRLNLAAAVALAAGLMANLGLQPVLHPDPPGLVRLVHAAAYGLAIWTGTFAAIGLALRFLSGPSPARRYIADSSYWIYLIHLPIVMVLQAWVSRFDWPWEAKFAAILGIGFALMFATYELLVRHTFIGAMLNGRRRPWRTPTATLAAPEAAR
ncbi:MAG: acyltransferase family protein [Caulobacterales bacterium]|nr:acyltransferase family protein [Caulobacterales bacterium]